jgi:hypothetical protein
MNDKPTIAQWFLIIAVLIIGFSYGISLLRERLSFFFGANIYNARIVRIDQEEKRKRKRGRFTAYIPVVEITDEKGITMQLRVDDYAESPVYRIGDRIKVLYNPLVYKECIVNTFSETWGDVLRALGIPLAISFPMLRSLYKRRNFYKNKSSLYDYKSGLDTFKKRSLELNHANPPIIRKRVHPLRRRRKKR